MKKSLIISLVIAILSVAFIVSFKVIKKQKNVFLSKIKELSSEKIVFENELNDAKKTISQKQIELNFARRQNYQEDLLEAQGTLKAANEKLSQVMSEKSGLENTNAVLNNRLKNTTNELSKTLDELKRARETLSGIEGQYKDKFIQLNDAVRLKEEQIKKLETRIGDKESASSDFQKQGLEYSDALRKYQSKINELEKTIATLDKNISDKDRALVKKEAELARYMKMPSSSRSAAQRSFDEVDNDRAALERQIAESSARLFEQQESIKGLEGKLVEMKDKLIDRERLLVKNSDELAVRVKELKVLRQQLQSGGSGQGYYSPSTDLVLSETQNELEAKVRQLENERRILQDKLQSEQRRTSGRADAKTDNKDLFADRNFRILTEAMVKKEEQIKQMETELVALRRDKAARESGSGLKEKRLAELEMLVNTLTKQLGEYAGLIEIKDRELKASYVKVESLMQEVEAHKVASIALQRELTEAKSRQEKTFQSLTQIMGFNADGNIPGSSLSSEYPATSSNSLEEAGSGAQVSGGDIRKRAEDLRRKVEVLLETKEK